MTTWWKEGTSVSAMLMDDWALLQHATRQVEKLLEYDLGAQQQLRKCWDHIEQGMYSGEMYSRLACYFILENADQLDSTEDYEYCVVTLVVGAEGVGERIAGFRHPAARPSRTAPRFPTRGVTGPASAVADYICSHLPPPPPPMTGP